VALVGKTFYFAVADQSNAKKIQFATFNSRYGPDPTLQWSSVNRQ